jgi:GT2 family glycosyltransferase
MKGLCHRVVILNYNNSDMTCACVRSVLGQSYRPLEVVVVDNHSTQIDYDNLIRLLPKEVKIVRTISNLGYSGGNNVGVKIIFDGCPEYIMISKNDVLFLDERTCEKLVEALENDPSRVACSPLVDVPDDALPPETTVQVRRIPNFYQLLVVHSCWLRRLPWLKHILDWYTYSDSRPYPRGRELDCESINGSCFIIRRQFLERIGYFDEGTFLYHEEIILGKQIKDLGNKASLVTSTVVLHIQGVTTGHGRSRSKLNMMRHMFNSELHFCRKYLKISRIAEGIYCLIRGVDILVKYSFDSLVYISKKDRNLTR